ncbi:MAG: DUF58 domain-containing protein [Gammaproteobacteria bacterium]|nr:DUF58 domain-containing protein [Gammaproteobacteria bacterium]
MIPTPRLLALVAVAALLGLLLPLGVLPAGLWAGWLGFVVVVAMADALGLAAEAPLAVERRVAGSLPLGVLSTVTLRIHNPGRRTCRVDITDHAPAAMEMEGLPRRLEAAAGGWTALDYRCRPRVRGEHRFPVVQLKKGSPLGLWQRTRRLHHKSVVRVYPDFAAVSPYAVYALDQQLSVFGALKRRRRGEGSEFHQLREFRQGDALRQIDWRATARMRRLISKEYQDERDQTLVFLLDCGRRMRTRDGTLSHFDQALNAMLLMSYVALRKGDAVGVSSFGGEARWLSPRKGATTLTLLLNTLYDLQPTLTVADYVAAATDLMARQRKRALVVLVTNLHGEEQEELRQAVALLRRRHLVVVTSLREVVLDEVMEAPVETLPDALRVAAAHDYMAERDHALGMLRQGGVPVVDVTPPRLSVAMVNAYLAIKAGGAL